jgi:hypothetical protein
MAKGVGDIGRFDVGPFSVLRVCVEKHVEWGFGLCSMGAEMVDEAAQGFARA